MQSQFADALVHLAAELERRLGLDGDLDDVPSLIVAVDEAHATLRQLARYWETFPQKDDLKTSPAIAALSPALGPGHGPHRGGRAWSGQLLVMEGMAVGGVRLSKRKS
ncbi:hypothetical protein ACWC9R_11840 [Streptomyces sp. NPDC001219]